MVRALPFQQLRSRLGVRKPHRHAVVVGDREPDAFRRKCQAADGRGHLDGFRIALARHHVSRLAGRPSDRAVRAGRDMVDPAALGVVDQLALAGLAGDEHLAVVTAGDDPDAVAGSREDAAAVDRKPLLVALGRDQQDLLFAQHEGRGVFDEIATTTGAPAATGRVRSTTEGVLDGVSVIVGSHPRSFRGSARSARARNPVPHRRVGTGFGSRASRAPRNDGSKLRRRSFQNPCGSFLPAVRGR